MEEAYQIIFVPFASYGDTEVKKGQALSSWFFLF